MIKHYLVSIIILLSLAALTGALFALNSRPDPCTATDTPCSSTADSSAASFNVADFNIVADHLTLATSSTHEQGLVINEFMASNGNTLADEDGDYSDWIELHNRAALPIALQGIGLSDDPEQPFRWTFPEITIAPDQYLLVWASGKDRSRPDAPLHTNFSISADGEPLLLTHPSQGRLDQTGEIAVPRDISYGRDLSNSNGDSDKWLFFDAPTPLAANSTPGYTEKLAPPVFSHTGGFYTDTFNLILQATDPAATILYTLDGSEPTWENLNGQSYVHKQNYPYMQGDPFGAFYTRTFHSLIYATGPISITDRSQTENRLSLLASSFYTSPVSYAPTEPIFKGTVVRARVVKEGALPSDIVTHTYFVTPEGAERYHLPVLSLAIQEDQLYDYFIGVYNPGIDFDEWRQNNPEGIISGHQAANYRRRGREWEHPVHLELFDPVAGRVLSQNLGFRIHGGWSRHLPQKSLRLYARNAYDAQAVLEYPFFPDLVNRYNQQPITTFKHILLRNSGNDSQKTRILDAFLHRLIQPLGLDQQAYQPAIHFINGEYWGLINLRERIDPDYFAAHYQIAPEHIAILEKDAILDAGSEADRQDFLELREYIATQDMRDPAHYTYVAQRMDIDNFIRYHVAQIYIKNTDWPHNNISAWRTTAPDTSAGAPYGHDGRWRWILFDLDHAFNVVEHNMLIYATDEGGYNNNNQWSTVMLRRLLENPNYRTRFINTMADSMNTIFLPDHVNAVIDATYDEIAPYIDEHGQRWSSGNTPPDLLREFARERPAWMTRHVVEFFELPGTAEITLDVSHPEHGFLRLTTIDITAQTPGLPDPAHPYPWRGTYYQDVPTTITAIAHPGYTFAGWLEYPDETSPTIKILPVEGLTLTALFESVSAANTTSRREPHRLSNRPFSLTAWPASARAESWPQHMLFEQAQAPDPTLDATMDELWRLPYNLESRSRIVGLDASGIGFINTGNPQAEPGAGYAGSAVVVLDTRNATAVEMEWLAGTVLANERQYGLRLQYRIGSSGEFQDVLDASGRPVEYLSHPQDGHVQHFTSVLLPAQALDRPVVEVRWRYYHVAGDSGPRAMIRLNNIQITAR